MSHLLKSVKILLFITAFTPLIVLSNLPFPFVFGKILFYRSVIEIALILFLVYLIFGLRKSVGFVKSQILNLIKNPMVIFLLLFLISLSISTIFAVNPYRAFWGDLERGEGLFGFLHFFVFLIMAVAVFEKKDWLNFFKISLGVGFILIFYAFLQYFNVKNFPFLFISEGRPFSFIGNPAFLASHMFFVIMSAIIAFHYSILKKFWRYFSLLIIILSVITIFLTATRGAILGLGVAILFLLIYFVIKKPLNFDPPIGGSKFLNIRRASIILLSLILIFSGFFWLTRDASVWQKVPGFNRLAKITTLNKLDSSTQFRLITWKLSLEAFKEKPVFGWGTENFLIAYERHYNPDYAVYGESWLDRAHNKIFDVLVMQGVFGLLAYLGIFIILVYKLLNNKNLQTYSLKNLFIVAAIIGYFIQNLFVMDQIISDIMFFAVLSYLIFIIKNKSTQAEDLQTYKLKDLKNVILGLLSLVLIIISGYSLYFYNYIPYVQAKIINEVKGIERASLIENKLRGATDIYNFSQFDLRAYIVDYYNNQQTYIFQDASFKPLSDFFVSLIDDIIEREPYDVRMFIRKSQMLQSKAINDTSLYKEAEDSMRQAIKLAPNRQELYYNLAFILLGQEKFQEAVEESIKAIELNPDVARAHYHLAFVLAVIGPQNSDEIIEEMEIADRLSPNLESLRSGDHNIIALIYNRLGRSDKVAEIVLKKINLQLPSKFLQIYYEEALGYFAAMRDADNFIKTAKDVTSSISTLKDDMDVLIDLAEKGNWEIVDKLSK